MANGAVPVVAETVICAVGALLLTVGAVTTTGVDAEAVRPLLSVTVSVVV